MGWKFGYVGVLKLGFSCVNWKLTSRTKLPIAATLKGLLVTILGSTSEFG